MNYKDEFLNNKILRRFFEIIPGFLIWVLLLSPVWGGLSIPYLFINLIVALSVYWVYRSLLLTLGITIGFFEYFRSKNINWSNEILLIKRENLENLAELPNNLYPKHLIVIPNYGEDYAVLKRSITAITRQNYPKELIYLAVSIEERKAKKDPDYAKRGELIKRDFGEFFGERLFFFVHPENLPNEEIGAASNRKWGTKNSVIELEKRGENLAHFLITAPDGDIVLSPNYLADVSYKWITSEKRNKKFYQTALYTFNNNYWEVPMLVRILMINITMPVLASSIFEKNKRETWSCFTLNLKLMKDVDYWDTTIPVGADDTTFFWRPYFFLNGDWKCEVFFSPLSADAVFHNNYFRNHVEQYKQYLRWGWGVISFPLAFKKLLSSKTIPFVEKFTKIYRLFEVFVFWKVIAFLIAFGTPIIFFVNGNLNFDVVSVAAPKTISTLLTFAIVLLVPNTLIKLAIIPKRPLKMSKLKYWASNLLEIPFNVVSLFTLGFIPFIDASTRMMFGSAKRKVKWSEKSSVK